MIEPVCQKCIYLAESQTKARPFPCIPIRHKDMICTNKNNAVKNYVTGEPYAPFCEEVNRHGECLVYMPEGLESPAIKFSDDDNIATIYGTNQFVIAFDDEELSADSVVFGKYDEDSKSYVCTISLEHTRTVKSACIVDGVLSAPTELLCEISDIPTIEFDKSTNTVTIKSYNKVYYSIDGSKVTEDSDVYTKPFVIDHNVTVKCRSYARFELSQEVTKDCDSIEPPIISFDSETKTVSIESDDTVLYSIDGSDIYDDADVYLEPFEIEDNTVVKAAALVEGELSEQVELECKIATVPTIEYDATTKTVSISSDDDILYTIDGSDVKKKSLVYTSAFKITETVTVKAKSIVDGTLSEQAELKCEVVPIPEISFDSDTNTVTITGAEKILYSVDGSAIYDDSDEYSTPFEIEKNTVVKAACIKNGILSDIVSLTCKVLGIPVITFDSRTKVVTITAENTVLYTTDGSDVKKKDSEYIKAFKITETTTVKAKSIIDGKMSEQAELLCEI